MPKMEIKNLRFEIIASSMEGFKEIQAIFDYKGARQKYFIFVKEKGETNYIEIAKKEFYKKLNNGTVAKTLKRSRRSASLPLKFVTCALGAIALALGGFLMYKMLQPNTGGGGDDPSDFATIIFDAGEGNKIEGSRKQTFRCYAEKGVTFGEVWKEIKYKGASKKNEDFLYWITEDGNPISENYIINDDVINLSATFKPVVDDCLTITARLDNTLVSFFEMRRQDIRYSLDHSSWLTPTYEPIYLNAGQQIYYRRITIPSSGYATYTFTKPCSISGPVEWEYNGNVTAIPDNAFLYFADNDNVKANLVSAYNLNFGNIVLSEYCCYGMFQDCSYLVEAPTELPLLILNYACYGYMFEDCISLKSAPEIKAANLTDYCFAGMFDGCTSLKISESEPGTKIFTCLDLASLEDPVIDMFVGTIGSFKDGTPTPNNTYYYY